MDDTGQQTAEAHRSSGAKGGVLPLDLFVSSLPPCLPPRGRVPFSQLLFTGSVHVTHKSANNSNPTMPSHIITLANMHINLDTHRHSHTK